MAPMYEAASQHLPITSPPTSMTPAMAMAVKRVHEDEEAAGFRRQDDLREQQSIYLREIIQLRADFATIRETHAQELRIAESARIDAIRAVDVGAVAAAAAVSATQATTLAAQVVASADAMRTQVAAVAQAATNAQNAALDPIQKDIQDLRRVQYEQVGQRIQVGENRDERNDHRGGINMNVAIIGLFVSITLGFFTIVTGLSAYMIFKP